MTDISNAGDAVKNAAASLEKHFKKCTKCQEEFLVLEGDVCGGCRALARDEADADREKRYKLERYNAVVRKALGDLGFDEFLFENYKPKTPSQQEALEICQSFDPNLQNLYLCGNTGVGKSHLAGAIYRGCLKYTDAMFMPAVDLKRQFLLCDGERDKVFLRNRLIQVPVLVIDDLGVGRDTEASNQIFYEIVEGRSKSYRKGLVVTTNLGLSTLAENMREDRTASRLNGICKRVYMDGPDHRKDGKA